MQEQRKQMEQVFTKYHQLLKNIDASDIFERRHQRTLRKNIARSKKMRRYRKSKFKLRQIGSALMDVMETNKQDLFTCPLCRKVLNVPVTVECGHTFCYDCLDKLSEKCSECFMDIQAPCSVNVLIQDFVNKWRETHHMDCQGGVVVDFGGFTDLEPRYCLRSRYAGLSSRSGLDENGIDRVFRRFFNESRRFDYFHSGLSRRKIEETISYGNEFIIDNSHNRDSLKHAVNDFFSSREQAVKDCWSHVTISDLECILCSQCYLDPITTACGHTFCRDCLARVLDHGLSCPLCMGPISPNDLTRGTTYILDQAMKMFAPGQYEERLLINNQEIQVLEKECEVPVFICTNAFPGVACPLYVYEPRYRLLARRCLQSPSKRFAMAAKTDGPFFACYGTVLEVKDAVHLQDGTSILTTVGIRRFKVLERGEKDGYDTAKVQFIRDSIVPNEKMSDLTNLHHRVHSKAVKFVRSLSPKLLVEIESSIGRMPELEDNWSALPDGPSWAWWLMPILPITVSLQIGFLSTTSLEKRLRAIDKMLEHMKVKMKALGRSTLNCNDANESNESCRFWLV